jgi:hypothetical protein
MDVIYFHIKNIAMSRKSGINENDTGWSGNPAFEGIPITGY